MASRFWSSIWSATSRKIPVLLIVDSEYLMSLVVISWNMLRISESLPEVSTKMSSINLVQDMIEGCGLRMWRLVS